MISPLFASPPVAKSLHCPLHHFATDFHFQQQQQKRTNSDGDSREGARQDLDRAHENGRREAAAAADGAPLEMPRFRLESQPLTYPETHCLSIQNGLDLRTCTVLTSTTSFLLARRFNGRSLSNAFYRLPYIITHHSLPPSLTLALLTSLSPCA